MIQIDIPGREPLLLEHLVTDLNGTLCLDGHLFPGVRDAMAVLQDRLDVLLLTADTFGSAQDIARELGATCRVLKPGQEAEQKAAVVRALGSSRTVAIGQGMNDRLMLREAALGICVLSPEGTVPGSLLAADILAAGGLDALQLLLHPQRIAATMRA